MANGIVCHVDIPADSRQDSRAVRFVVYYFRIERMNGQTVGRDGKTGLISL